MMNTHIFQTGGGNVEILKKLLFVVLLLAAIPLAHADVYGDAEKIGIEAKEGYPRLMGFGLYPTKIVEHSTTATTYTITTQQSGSLFYMDADADSAAVVFNLPPIEAGLVYMFADMSATAAEDLTINPDDDDRIAGTNADGDKWAATGDAVGETVVLFALDDSTWIRLSQIGTWADAN